MPDERTSRILDAAIKRLRKQQKGVDGSVFPRLKFNDYMDKKAAKSDMLDQAEEYLRKHLDG